MPDKDKVIIKKYSIKINPELAHAKKRNARVREAADHCSPPSSSLTPSVAVVKEEVQDEEQKRTAPPAQITCLISTSDKI